MSKCILRLENLRKSFRSHWTFRPVQALHGINLEVYQGESFGFLGPNGAGKTTTIKCIVGLLPSFQGQIEFYGASLKQGKERARIGFLPEQPYFYDHLSVWETLEFFASLHGYRGAERRAAVSDTLERVQLADRVKSPLRTLSKGLQQRLGFAQAIINRPDLLILDEPFSGLDPLGRAHFRKLIIDLNRQGTTIFLSSHILPDVEDICDRVSIMAKGKLRKIFSLGETASLFGESFYLTLSNLRDREALLTELSTSASQVFSRQLLREDRVELVFASYEDAQQALARCVSEGVKVESFKPQAPSLEEVFLRETGIFEREVL